MNFKKAWELMHNYKGSNYTLDRIKHVLTKLNNPQDEYYTIHIAGTNGKGSLNAFMTSILINNGFKVGSYTSPAVFTPLEVIKYNNKNISQKDFSRLFEEAYNVCLKENIDLTSFEYMTVICYLYFREKNVDYAVIECGCGGDLDATNVEEDNIAVFGDISLDHVDLLGPTLKDIVHHKAGIMRKDEISFNYYEDTVNSYLEEEAQARGCKFYSINYPVMAKLNLYGEHQQENAALALSIACYLELDEEKSIKGMKEARLLGRLSFYKHHTILDGSHNPKAGEILVDELSYLKFRKHYNYIIVLGMFKDKAYQEYIDMLKHLDPLKVYVYTTLTDRALPAETLASSWGDKALICSSIEEATQMSLESLKDYDYNKTYVVYCGTFSSLSIIKGVIDHAKYK